MVMINYFSYRDEDIFHQRQQEIHSGPEQPDKQKHRNSIPAFLRFVGPQARPDCGETGNIAGAEEMSEGKVIINKLHRFLRQRSVPASTGSTGSNGGSQEEAGATNNNLKVQIVSNSEGSSPMKEMSPNGEISLLNEKNDLTKNLLLATDIDGSVGIWTDFLFSILI